MSVSVFALREFLLIFQKADDIHTCPSLTLCASRIKMGGEQA